MSLFGTILEKLGLKKEQPVGASGAASAGQKPATPASPPQPVAAPRPAPEKDDALERTSSAGHATLTPAAPTPISEVDVVKKLEGLAAAQPLKLNWRTSISDLLFLLGMENSFQARKELATELGCPPELMNDSAKMNTWLHKKVLQEIAANGGNIPKELLN